MNLYEELGDSLNPEFTRPKGWPIWAPDYNSPAGWEFEKRLTLHKLLFQEKDQRANDLIDRAMEMGNACLDAGDNDLAKKYIAIMERLIAYRENLRKRYPLGSI